MIHAFLEIIDRALAIIVRGILLRCLERGLDARAVRGVDGFCIGSLADATLFKAVSSAGWSSRPWAPLSLT